MVLLPHSYLKSFTFRRIRCISKDATNFEDSPLASEFFDSNREAQKIDSEKVTSRKGMNEKVVRLGRESF